MYAFLVWPFTTEFRKLFTSLGYEGELTTVHCGRGHAIWQSFTAHHPLEIVGDDGTIDEDHKITSTHHLS